MKSLKFICRCPNADRAAETSNNIAEGMFDLVTRELAIEAAAYWQYEFDKLQRQLNGIRMRAAIKSAELALGVALSSRRKGGN